MMINDLGAVRIENSRGQLYIPHAQQLKFHHSKARFRAFVGGVGSGKTLAGCIEALKYCVDNSGVTIMIVGASYRMLQDATMKTLFEFLPKRLIKEFRRGKRRLILINGSEIWFRSADDPESLRGPNLHAFFLDEAAKCSKAAWDILIGRIRAPGAPNIAWVATTPKGFNWVYQVFVKQGAGLDDYDIIFCASYLNPHLPDDFITSLKEGYSGSFYQQEVEGKFVPHEGVVYSDFSRDVHVKKVDLPAHRYKRIFGGIDWGYSNPMCALIGLVDADGNLHVAREIYQSRLKIEDFASLLKETEKELAKTLGVDSLEVSYFADPSDVGLGTGSMMTYLRNKGFNLQKANNSVMSGINRVSTRLKVDEYTRRSRLLIDPSCVNTLSEFEQYSFKEQEFDKPHKDKPLKINDHAMDALRYMVMAIDQGEGAILLEGGGGVIF